MTLFQTLAAALVLCMVSSQALAFDCTGRSDGYYCADNGNYHWCYPGATVAPAQACSAGTVCGCGFTAAANPCTWPDQLPSDCDGNPGDYTGGSPPTTTTTTAPATTSEPTTASTSAPTTSGPTSPPTTTSPTTSPTTAPPSGEEKDKKVIGYFTNWSQYRQGDCQFKPPKIDATKFTHICYAFAFVEDLTYKIVPFEWNDAAYENLYSQVTGLMDTNPGLKVLLSIGGWTFNENPATNHIFSNLAATAASRTAFATYAVTFLRQHNFAGLDIDWEYPGVASQGGNPADTENFTLLLKETRRVFNAETVPEGKERLLLSIASAAGPANFAPLQLGEIHKHLDWVGLMSYDFHGAWDPVTGSLTNMSEVEIAVDAYLDGGVPADKLVMGFATYGRTWKLSNPSVSATMGSPASGAAPQGYCTGEAGFMSLYEINDAIAAGATTFWDDESKTPYFVDGSTFCSYVSEASYDYKIAMVKEKGLAGGMVWAMDLDDDYQLITYLGAKLWDGTSSTPSPSTTAPTNGPTSAPTTTAPLPSPTPAPVTDSPSNPVGFQFINPTASTLTGKWTPPVVSFGRLTYSMRWRQAGSSAWTTIDGLGTECFSHTLSALSANTTYEAMLRSVAVSGSTSSWTGIKQGTTSL